MSYPYTQNPTQYSASHATDIPVHFKTQYYNYVKDMAQQKASRARGLFEETQIVGEKIVYELTAPDDLDQVTQRYGSTNYAEAKEYRREMSLTRYNKAFLVDDMDVLKLVEDPKNIYVRKMAMAQGRKWDDVIFAAAFATVTTGHTGGSSVAWEASNSDCTILTDGQTTGLTLDLLIEAGVSLDEGEFMEADEERYIFLPPRAVGDLLKDDRVPSADYNTVRSLVNGQLNTFFGFRFVKTNRLPTTDDGQYYRAFACAKSAIVCASREKKTQIGPDPGKQWKTAVYSEIELGALRTQEKAIVEIQLPVLPLGDMDLIN
jgi:hypothetical protein